MKFSLIHCGFATPALTNTQCSGQVLEILRKESLFCVVSDLVKFCGLGATEDAILMFLIIFFKP